MHIKIKFHRQYFILTILIFAIEFLIAAYVHNKIIRPYIGDFLVVILLYCFLKSFFDAPIFATALFVLFVSYVVEISQYFKLVNQLGLQNSKFARIVLGSSFEWTDLVMYTTGIVLVLYVEKMLEKKMALKKMNKKT